MKRRSRCAWMPMLPWPIWPLAGHARLGQNVVVGAMTILLSWLCWGASQEEVCLDPCFLCNLTPPRFSVELPKTRARFITPDSQQGRRLGPYPCLSTRLQLFVIGRGIGSLFILRSPLGLGTSQLGRWVCIIWTHRQSYLDPFLRAAGQVAAGRAHTLQE